MCFHAHGSVYSWGQYWFRSNGVSMQPYFQSVEFRITRQMFVSMPDTRGRCHLQSSNQHHDHSAADANDMVASYASPKKGCITVHLLHRIYASVALEGASFID